MPQSIARVQAPEHCNISIVEGFARLAHLPVYEIPLRLREQPYNLVRPARYHELVAQRRTDRRRYKNAAFIVDRLFVFASQSGVYGSHHSSDPGGEYRSFPQLHHAFTTSAPPLHHDAT